MVLNDAHLSRMVSRWRCGQQTETREEVNYKVLDIADRCRKVSKQPVHMDKISAVTKPFCAQLIPTATFLCVLTYTHTFIFMKQCALLSIKDALWMNERLTFFVSLQDLLQHFKGVGLTRWIAGLPVLLDHLVHL